MKTTYIRLSIATAILLGIYSCKKGEATGTEISDYAIVDSALATSSDSISSAAVMKAEDKQFIKTANVNMEVKDVYDATIFIEKSAQELGGFVTHSNLKSNVLSDKTYNVSNEEDVLVKKYQSENTMQVRVPTPALGELLNLINKKNLFLNSRSINAEDITSNMKYAELEGQRMKKTGKNIAQLKTDKDKVNLDNENMSEKNMQQLSRMNITDNLKYSIVDIYIKEPKVRIAEIAVANTNHIEDKYRFDFLYSAKKAFIEGYYLIQKIVLLLIIIWPVILIGAAVLFFYRKRKPAKKPTSEISHI